jgi:hypothetical protein
MRSPKFYTPWDDVHDIFGIGFVDIILFLDKLGSARP